jgi:hypothetical protein
MTVTRVSLDSVAWPLWLIGIALSAIAITYAVTTVRQEQRANDAEATMQQAFDQMQRTLAPKR